MDEITVNQKVYITLDRAAGDTEYDREYLRKLARSKKIDGIQIGDTWMVNLDSIYAYRDAKPQRRPHSK